MNNKTESLKEKLIDCSKYNYNTYYDNYNKYEAYIEISKDLKKLNILRRIPKDNSKYSREPDKDKLQIIVD